MHPVVLDLAGIPLGSYGLLAAAGFLTALVLGVRAGRRRGIPVERLLDLAFWILISSLLGSRLLHVVTEAGRYYRRCAGDGSARGLGRILYDCSSALHLWEGGLVFYGGLLAATGAVIWYCRRHRLDFLVLADLIAPPLALGHALGRLGCLAAGCCYGKPSLGACGLSFPPGSVAFEEMKRAGLLVPGALATPALHPTQLYEALAELGIFFLLLLVARRRWADGSVVLAYAALYATARFVIELFRADPDRRYLAELPVPWLSRWLGLPPQAPVLLSTSQLISLGVLLLCLLLLLWRRRQRNLSRPAGSLQPGDRS